MQKQYVALVHTEKKGRYGLTVFDFPKVVVKGATLVEVLSRAEKQLQAVIDNLVEQQEQVPPPTNDLGLVSEWMKDKYFIPHAPVSSNSGTSKKAKALILDRILTIKVELPDQAK